LFLPKYFIKKKLLQRPTRLYCKNKRCA